MGSLPDNDEHIQTVYHTQEGPQGTLLEIGDFCLWDGKTQALFDISMTVEKGLVTALIGPSGCGKSTLLRAINRMNDLIDGLSTKGRISLDGTDIYSRNVDVIAPSQDHGHGVPKAEPFPHVHCRKRLLSAKGGWHQG